MTASESSFVGLAKQTALGTPASTGFQYFMFSEGSLGPQNNVIPLDQEVGGGALLRDMAKVGVLSAGAFSLIPRPETLGWFLLGALGDDAITGAGPSYTHAFTLGTDQFAAPYFTVRGAPGNLWGEQFQDCRINGLSINWRAADYVRAQVGFFGGLPAKTANTTGWGTPLDSGPPLLAPITTVELPTGTAAKVLSGAVNFGMAIPLEEQWITGSYSPDAFDINSRSVAITLALKVTDASLYTKMSYDPAAGTAWVVDMMREASFLLEFQSEQEADTGVPYSLTIAGNGQNQASGDANVVWSCQPIALRAGRQVTMAVTGVFLADPLAGAPVTATLVNLHATAYDA